MLRLGLPMPVVELVQRGSWSRVLLRASWNTRRTPAMQRLVQDLQFPSDMWVQSLRAAGRYGHFAPPAALSFSRESAADVVQKLRQHAPLILSEMPDEEARASEAFQLEQMVSRLDAFAAPSGRHIDAKTLVASFASAMQLRNRATLRTTVQRVFDNVFPGCDVDISAWSKIPSPSPLARAQLLFDAAFCGVMKRRFASLRGPIYMLADSSPQAGHDYLLSTCLMISVDMLEKCWDAAQFMRSSWDDFLSAYQEQDTVKLHQIVVKRQENGAVLKEGVAVHRMIPMALGQALQVWNTRAEHLRGRCLQRHSRGPFCDKPCHASSA